MTEYYTKYGGLSTVLRAAHFSGILSLPDYYKEAWKNTYHRYYSEAVLVFFTLINFSSIVEYFKNSCKDTAEMYERSLEICFIVFIFCQTIYVRFKKRKLLHIVFFLHSRYFFHRNDPTVVAFKRKEKIWMNVCLLVHILSFACIHVLYIFVPKPASKLETLARVYNLKYPHHQLPIPLYVPYIDRSELAYYIPLYFVEFYWTCIFIVQNMLSVANFGLIPTNLKLLYTVLNKYIEVLGGAHRDIRGISVVHTNISRGESKVVDIPISQMDFARNTNIIRGESQEVDIPISQMDFARNTKKERLLDLCNQYDYFYFKQIIQYQQGMSNVRKLIDYYLTPIWGAITITMLSSQCIIFYCLLTPGLLTGSELKVVVIESIGFSVCGGLIFIGGEILASCNRSWERAFFRSCWYKCSRDTRRMIPLLIMFSQQSGYLSVKGLFQCSYTFMLSILKMGYSMCNVLRFQNLKNL